MSKQIFAQIFIDSGNGFNEAESIRTAILYGSISLNFNLEAFEVQKRLRFDPVNKQSVIKNLKIQGTDSKGNSFPVSISSSNSDKSESSKDFIFLTKDPNIFLSIEDHAPLKSLQIEFDHFSDESILENFGHKILESSPGSINYIFDGLTKLIRSINSKIIGMEAEMTFHKSLSEKSNNEIIVLFNLLEQNMKNQNDQIEFLTGQLKQLQEIAEIKDKEKEILEKNLEDIKKYTKDFTKTDDLKDELVRLETLNLELQKENKALLNSNSELSEELEKIQIQLKEFIKLNEHLKTSLDIRKDIEKQQDKELKLLHLDIKNLEKVSIKSITRLETQNIDLKERLKSTSRSYKSLEKNYRKQLVANGKLEDQIKDLQAISQQYSKLIEEIEHIVQD